MWSSFECTSPGVRAAGLGRGMQCWQGGAHGADAIQSMEPRAFLPISRGNPGEVASLLHASTSPPVKRVQRFHVRTLGKQTACCRSSQTHVLCSKTPKQGPATMPLGGLLEVLFHPSWAPICCLCSRAQPGGHGAAGRAGMASCDRRGGWSWVGVSLLPNK